MERLQTSRVRRLVIVGALLCSWAWTPPAAADCGAPRRVVRPQYGAISGQAVYRGTQSGGAVSLYDITFQNSYGAWYVLRRSDPTSGGCWPWPGDPRVTSPTGLPDRAFIGPNGSLTYTNVPLRDGDRFAFCQVGLRDPDGQWFFEDTDMALVALINALDIVGLGLFGEEIGSDLAQGAPEGTIVALLLELLREAGAPLTAAVGDAMWTFSQEGVGFWQVAEAAYNVGVAVLQSVPSPTALANVLQRLGVRRAATLSARLLSRRFLAVVAFVPNAIRLIRRSVDAYRAYRDAPAGYVGFTVVAAPLSGDGPPSGQITSPREGETVGNSVTVSGVATDDCAAVQYVNLTYTTDNWATWHYVGQDASAPYGFTVNLAAVPDGTTVKFGWDVYDTTGHHADSPRGNRTVTKNAAALAPPRDDAAYVADVNYPDGTVVSANVAFNKTWRIRNSGTSSWAAGYRLAHAGGTNLAAVSEIALPALGPGQTGDVTVAMRTPLAPGEYVSYWRPKNAGGTAFGSTVWVLIEVRCESPDCGSCPESDRCLNMGCSAHNPPADGVRFKTPATGPGVYYGRGGYKHPFPDSTCYFLFYDAWTGLQCIANDEADDLTTAPYPCRSGSFLREEGDSTLYRLESDRLRPLCGIWTNAQFRAQFGHPFDVALLVDEEHWPGVRARYPLGAAIYPSGSRAPACGDPGYECGTFIDPDVECFGSLTCTCPAAADCVSHRCVTREPEQTLVAGRFISPEDGEVVPNQCFDVQWEPGYASDGAGTQTALYCQDAEGTWDLRAGFGFTPPLTICDLPPGSDFTCKLRTRLAGDYGTWVDGTAVTWHVNADWARMVVTDVTVSPDPMPNGCEDLRLTATIQNAGEQFADWRVRAFLHPADADETSPLAVRARFDSVAFLEMGETGNYSFRIDLPGPLPLAEGALSVTVIVDDYYHGFVAPASRRSVPAYASDDESPQVSYFTVYGYPGTPTQVLPGRTHQIGVDVTDAFALDRWEVRWREAGQTWQALAGSQVAGNCRTQHNTGIAWAVPATLEAGRTIEVSLRVWDLSGRSAEQTVTVLTRSNAEPTVTFLAPAGGEQYVRSTEKTPTCVPVDFAFTPGVEIRQMHIGYANADHSQYEPNVPEGTVWPIPTDGRIVRCLEAMTVGDAVHVYVWILDANGREFWFLSPDIRVDFPAPLAPWSPVVVEQTQLPLPRNPGGNWPTTGYETGTLSADEFVVYRDDLSWWQTSDRVFHQVLGLRKLTLNRATGEVDSVQDILAPATVDLSEDEFHSPSAIQNLTRLVGTDLYSLSAEIPRQPCADPSSDPCDYDAYFREVRGGSVTNPTVLGTYAQRTHVETPYRSVLLVAPDGGRILTLRNVSGGVYRLDMYHESAGSWRFVATMELPLQLVGFLDERLLGVRTTTAPDGSREMRSYFVDTGTGALSGERLALRHQGSLSTWSTKDAYLDALFVMGFDYDTNELLLARYAGGTWEALGQYLLPFDWRGQPTTGTYPTDIRAANGRLFITLQVVHDGQREDVLLAFRAGDAPDLDRGYLDVWGWDFSSGLISAGSDGSLLRIRAYCQWNLESRLCLQLGQPLDGDCYDADPCTADEWDPQTGVCNYPPIACEQDGDLCNGPEVCDPATGTCVTDPEQAPACDDGAPCNGQEACDPATGECTPGAPPALDDGYACTDDACAPDGTVGNTPNDARCAGDACALALCRPDDPAADPETGCVETPRPVVADGLPCTQDGCNPRNGAPVYVLLAGYCLIDGACVPADAPEPGNPCAACVPERSAVAWSPAAEGAPCDDGQFCTETDACVQGACMGRVRACDSGSEPTCGGSRCDEAADACLPLVADDGTPCDDFDLCNGRETCAAGHCTNGLPPDLGAPGPCLERVCDALEGVIERPSAGPCDDHDPCTEGDTCTDGACAGIRVADCCATAADCNDGDPCTLDRCEGQRCRHESSPVCACTQDAECANGDPCDGAESCVAGTCQAGAAPDCDDHDPCTDDACVAGAGCQHAPHERDCDDRNACTADDRCMSGACLGWPIDCDDANPCTADACEPLGGCTHAPQDSACADDDPCSETACLEGVCSIVGRVAGCCGEDADCALPAELCVDRTCVQVLCTPCAQDAQCGAEWNRCMQLPSGKRCLVDCEDAPESCPTGAHCERLDEGHAQCLPDSGDCECTPRVGRTCDGDRVVYVDSCGRPGEPIMTCEGRGCVDGACCPIGEWAQDGVCVGQPGPDAGGQPVDATGMPDSRDAADTANGEAVTGPRDGADAGRTDGSPASPDVGSGGGGGGCAAGMAGAVPTWLGFAAGLLLALATTRRRSKRAADRRPHASAAQAEEGRRSAHARRN